MQRLMIALVHLFFALHGHRLQRLHSPRHASCEESLKLLRLSLAATDVNRPQSKRLRTALSRLLLALRRPLAAWVSGRGPSPVRRQVTLNNCRSSICLASIEDEVANRLANLKKGNRRRSPRPKPAVPATSPLEAEDLAGPRLQPAVVAAQSGKTSPSSDAALPSTVDTPVWTVPEELRMPGEPPATEHGYHVSLESIFPGTGLADAWDTCSSLRVALRQALRNELMAPLLRNLGESQRQAALSLSAACMISWSNALGALEQGKVSFDGFTDAFRAHGVNLDGPTFFRKMGALCGETPHGSLIDIIPLDRAVAHSWHQDTGIPQHTVLLGFPPRDGYVGGGVFSNFVKLSHPLRPSEGEEHGSVVQFELLTEPPPPPIPEEYVFRPIYGKGREVWVSNDATHLHSTPDRQLRECLWRFM